MTKVSYHDIEWDGKTYIMEWRHREKGYIAITEACDDEEAAANGICDSHETYDFEEVE